MDKEYSRLGNCYFTGHIFHKLRFTNKSDKLARKLLENKTHLVNITVNVNINKHPHVVTIVNSFDDTNGQIREWAYSEDKKILYCWVMLIKDVFSGVF